VVADNFNLRIRVLSADLQQVSTVAGDGLVGTEDDGGDAIVVDGNGGQHPGGFSVPSQLGV